MCRSAQSKTAKFKDWNTKDWSYKEHLTSTLTPSQTIQNATERTVWEISEWVFPLGSAFANCWEGTHIWFIPFYSINTRQSCRTTLVTEICKNKQEFQRVDFKCAQISLKTCMRNTNLFTNGNIIKDINEPYCVRSCPEVNKAEKTVWKAVFQVLECVLTEIPLTATTKSKSSLKRCPYFKDVQKDAWTRFNIQNLFKKLLFAF